MKEGDQKNGDSFLTQGFMVALHSKHRLNVIVRMIIYNVTINISPDVEEDWKAWMKDHHIPDMIQTGCFESAKFLRLLNESPDAEGNTYAIQYFARDQSSVDHYLEKFAPKLRAEHTNRYRDKFVAFRTLLEEV